MLAALRSWGLAAALLLGVAPAAATPPNYVSLHRLQRTTVDVDPDDVLRVWIVYVGQGDGIVIQLPRRFSREPAAEQGGALDVVIDGGSFRSSNVDRLRRFVHQLYPEEPIEIEHAIITHHDEDHVAGLTQLLEDREIGVGRIYHNGLASYLAGARGLPSAGRPDQAGVFTFNTARNMISRALGAE